MLIFEHYYRGIYRKTALAIIGQVHGEKVGEIYQDRDGCYVAMCEVECTASRCRQIAEKLDELNSKDKHDEI